MADLAATLLQSRLVRKLITGLETKIPPLRAWHRFEFQQHFVNDTDGSRLFSGVYATFEEAIDAAPKNGEIGCDNPEAADFRAHEIGRIWPSDYSVMCWLQWLLHPGSAVFDLGGGPGISYYGFQKYLQFPQQVTWEICDLPSVVQSGRELVSRNGGNGPSFTTDFRRANACSILLASASLQFISKPLWISMKDLRSLPRHILINRTPLWDGKTFITLHRFGRSLCPYRIGNRREFLAGLTNLGYTLIDSWEVPEFSCYIPFHPMYAIRSYSGMYLRLKS